MTESIDRRMPETDQEDTVRFLIGLLGFALFVTLSFLLIYLRAGQYGPARIVGGLGIAYALGLWLLRRRRHVHLVMHLAVFSSIVSMLFSMHLLPVTAVWLPITAVSAFALLQRQGAVWALLQFVGICIVLIADALSAHPLYSPASRLNILFSIIAVVILCYVFLIQMQKKQRMIVAYAERLANERAARERHEMARRLAGGMAHLINNEMQIIISRSHFLKAKLPQSMDSDLDAIVDVAMQASGHTLKLLNYAEGGRYRKQRFDAHRIAQRVANNRSQSLPDGILLHHAIGEGPVICHGDASEMEQVLDGLIENAVEACPDGGAITLGLESTDAGASATGETPPRRYAKITVADDGRGMSEAVQAQIFEPFFTTNFPGRGLGLSAILGIVHHYGGELAVESREGAGSLFTVWWPQSGEDDGKIHDRMPPSSNENEERT